MIIELDTSLLKQVDNLSLGQFVFLNLLKTKINQKNYQSIIDVIRLVSDNEIEDLVNRQLIQKKTDSKGIAYDTTDILDSLLKPRLNLFDKFYEAYPVMVIRPDGTKGFLRGNSQKCRDFYNKLVKNDVDLHDHIMKCLNYDISNKTITGKLGYMKTMWKWLTTREWESIEDQMQDEMLIMNQYGTNIL